ncbi:putative ABC transport system permease protein [Dyadobacter soli]|uniref:Putative ABC transport system permease protein n=1 Tax=Dyadobacter soli TaxID=659014 RepID=A0A1G7HPA8_9BACT|nr:ABC transporter permease [Dyadobacter soli]SDF02260.1 putative ABC transport system permease protein [Dyadobacter soli]
MLKNYFKIAFRSLWKNRLFTAINVLGLSLGLASAGVLILFIQRGITFDTFHKDNDQLYFVQTADVSGRYNQTVYPILEQMVKTFPEVETGTHVQSWNDVWLNHNGKDLQRQTRYVDSTFFDVFSFKLKYGNAAIALKRKQSIVLSDQAAAALFGDVNPVGETVTVEDTLTFTVTGVLEPVPANSSIQFEVLLPASNLQDNKDFASSADWYNTFATVYLKLRKDTDVGRLEAKFPTFAKTHFHAEGQKWQIHIAPLEEYIHYENPNFKWMIYGAITIAVFIVLIISINMVNLNTAMSFTRVKEVAVRKVTGSTLGQVLAQFWTESALVLIASLLIAVTFGIMYLVPQFNEFRQGRMQLVVNWQRDSATFLTLTGIIGIIAFIAGTIPAAYLNKLDLRDTLKGKLSGKPGYGNWTQGTLIVVQLVIAIVLVIGAIAVRWQIDFMRQADTGFKGGNVVVVMSDLQYKDENAAIQRFVPILNGLGQNSKVESIAMSGIVPTRYWSNYNMYTPDGEEKKNIRLRHVGTSTDYTSTYDIRMVEGRDFSEELDKKGDQHPVVINEAARKAFGWTTAVGKTLRQGNNTEVYTVVGVMKDFHYGPLKERIEPLLHWYNGPPALSNYLSLKFTDISQAQGVLAALEKDMKSIPSKRPFKYFYMQDELSRQYNDLDGIWKMVNFVTFLAIIIAFAGIFGLISLAASKRTKEIGIRKVLGASVQGIAMLLSRDFIILLVIAMLAGLPLAYTFVIKYLASFEYHVDLPWYIFVLVALGALLLTVVTVGFQGIKAALADPVKSLRSE